MTQITKEAIEAAEREFAEYFVRNYPGPDTIIFDPKWHAPKLFRAATHSLISSPGKDGGQEVEAVEWQGRYWIENENRWSNWITNPVGYRWAHEPQEGKSEIRYLYPQPASTALVERLVAHCQTCDDTGKEGRHSICRDCDESVGTQPADEIWIEPYPPADPIRGQDWSETNAWGQQATKYVRADIAETLTGSKDGGNDL